MHQEILVKHTKGMESDFHEFDFFYNYCVNEAETR